MICMRFVNIIDKHTRVNRSNIYFVCSSIGISLLVRAEGDKLLSLPSEQVIQLIISNDELAVPSEVRVGKLILMIVKL